MDQIGRKLVFSIDDDHAIVIEKIIKKQESDYSDLQTGEVQLLNMYGDGNSTVVEPAICPDMNTHSWEAIIADPSFWVSNIETS